MQWKLHLSTTSLLFLGSLSILSFHKPTELFCSNSTIILEWYLTFNNSSFIEFVIVLDWMSCLFQSFVSLISANVLF